MLADRYPEIVCQCAADLRSKGAMDEDSEDFNPRSFNFWVSDETKKRIELLARANSKTQAEIIREAIEVGLDIIYARSFFLSICKKIQAEAIFSFDDWYPKLRFKLAGDMV